MINYLILGTKGPQCAPHSPSFFSFLSSGCGHGEGIERDER